MPQGGAQGRQAESAGLRLEEIQSEVLEVAQPGPKDHERQQTRGQERKLGEPVKEDVVAEADEKQQQQVAVSARGQRIKHEKRHPPTGNHGNIDGQAKDIVLNPANEEGRGALFDIWDAHPFGEKVVAVEFDEGIEIDDDYGYAGNENDLVTEIVNPLARLGVGPHEDGHTA